ncbi:MAG: periplasmic heavy metal sensor [Candidatus Omnitrophota bacterium]|jgi:Spy/CpxP family protein refolding chaperone
MNRKKAVVVGVLALSIFFVWVQLAQAQGKGEGPYVNGRGPSEEMIQKMDKELGITPEQSAQLKAHRTEHREKMKVIKESTKQKKDQLKAELEKPEVDQGVVKQIATELKNLQAQLIDMRIDGILFVKSILTPEQFEKFKEHAPDKMKQKGKDGKQGHNMRGGPKGLPDRDPMEDDL